MADSEPFQTISSRSVRPLVPPRPTPPSFQGGFDLASPIEDIDDAQSIPSSGAQSPSRGRTLHRISQRSRRVSRATTRRYTILESAHTEWEERLTKYAGTAASNKIDHSVLEPLPFDRFRTSLSEELHRAATFDSSIDLETFGGHRDTFGLIQLRNFGNPCTKLPFSFFAQISPYLDIETYKATRLTCHSWSVAMHKARPIKAPPVVMLPAEVLEQILVALSPIDFNAARHTCREWMRTSLEPRLLTLMLKRGGWSRAFAADLRVMADQNANRRLSIGNDDWYLSKRLATECSLSPEWSGRGIQETQANVTSLQLTSQIDFSGLGVDAPPPLIDHDSGADVHFTISTCTGFLLAYRLRIIYIYAFKKAYDGSTQPYGGHIEFVTSIVCPEVVLAVSMDASCQRYAVAALLRGAVGIVHDLDLVRNPLPWTNRDASRNRVGLYDRWEGSVFIPPVFTEWPHQEPSLYTQATFGTIHNAPRNRTKSRDDAEAKLGSTPGEALKSRTWAIGDRFYAPQPIETAFHAYVPFHTNATGAGSSVYRNLCRIDGPPRSVAICPQRRCVAFGCQHGIQLHWLDALTGQEMNRSFPLSSPADHLFFMPTRDNMDGSRKLRLISSAGAPSLAKDAMQSRPYCHSTDSEKHGEADQKSHGDNILYPPNLPEYYNAVPLSDGRHLLITVPATGELCLAEDATRTLGAEKIVKRYTFVGPKISGEKAIIPHVYTSASALQWGIRVAAAYRDRLWLFVIPPDRFFEQNKPARRSNASGSNGDTSLNPVRVAGVEIASIEGLTNLTLDGSAGDLTLWAFSSDATASIFQLTGRTSKAVTQRLALHYGDIVLTLDEGGDSVMIDSPELRSTNGDVSMTDAHSTRDADGDVLMTDLAECPGERPLQSDGTASFTQDWPSSSVPCFPSCGHRYCNFLLHLDNGTLMHNQNSGKPPHGTSWPFEEDDNATHAFTLPQDPASYPQLEDEGYASGADEGLDDDSRAIYVPPLWGVWDPHEDTEWVPDEC